MLDRPVTFAKAFVDPSSTYFFHFRYWIVIQFLGLFRYPALDGS